MSLLLEEYLKEVWMYFASNAGASSDNLGQKETKTWMPLVSIVVLAR